MSFPVSALGLFVCAAALYLAFNFAFFVSLAGIASYQQRMADLEARYNYDKELSESYVEYKNEKLGFSVFQPKEVIAKEMDISTDSTFRRQGLAGVVNFYRNDELYFAVEAVPKGKLEDSDFVLYDDLAHAVGGGSGRESRDFYIHLASSKPDCTPREIVRLSCKTYFVSKFAGSKYTYILSGFAEEFESLGSDIKPTAYISDHSYDKMLFSFKALDAR